MSQESQTVPESTPHDAKRWIIIGLSSALLFTGFYTFLYFTEDSKTKEPHAVHIPQPCEDFNTLPQSVQSSYVPVEEFARVQQEVVALQTQLNLIASDAAFEIPPQSQQEQASQTPSSASDDALAVKRIKEIAKCYDMDSASQKLSTSCRESITAYVDAHPDAKYFEIIGVVDDQEFNLFNNLERRKNLYKSLGVDDRVVAKMKDLARRGLSKIRAAEASWVIKTHTKHHALTYNANYEIVSSKGHRGVIIRAYEVEKE